jgi:hypothetical protein
MTAMTLSAFTAFTAFTAPAPALPPAPTGMGDWLDSSFELHRGMQMRELYLPWWDDVPASPGSGLGQPTAH